MKKEDGRKHNKSNLPKDANGKVLPSKGRPKGTPNRLSGQAKENIAAVFDSAEMNGIQGMIEWAVEHKTEFYVNVYPKLLPMMVQGHINAEVDVSGEGQLLADAMVTALTRTIESARRARDAGDASEGVGVILDNIPAEQPVPQLVLPSKARTKAA